MGERALVRNAADPQQVRKAEKKERWNRREELDDIRAILSLPAGRRFLWRLLTHCKAFESIWHASALIHYNAGMQDVGHFLMDEITEANAQAFVGMIGEFRQPQEIEEPEKPEEGQDND